MRTEAALPRFASRAEAVSPLRIDGDAARPAVLLIHGFTGSPASLKPLAEQIAAAGLSVSVPRLPGHGGDWRDVDRSSWREWLGCALDEFDRLAAEHPAVVVLGLSMGGGLALRLAELRSPERIVLVNPALRIDSPFAPLLGVLAPLLRSLPAIGGDIAKPGEDEWACDRTPLRAAHSMSRGLGETESQLWAVDCPVDLLISGSDAVVGPWSVRRIRTAIPADRLTVASLRRSRHVATLDYDADIILTAALRAAGAADV